MVYVKGGALLSHMVIGIIYLTEIKIQINVVKKGIEAIRHKSYPLNTRMLLVFPSVMNFV